MQLLNISHEHCANSRTDEVNQNKSEILQESRTILRFHVDYMRRDETLDDESYGRHKQLIPLVCEVHHKANARIS